MRRVNLHKLIVNINSQANEFCEKLYLNIKHIWKLLSLRVFMCAATVCQKNKRYSLIYYWLNRLHNAQRKYFLAKIHINTIHLYECAKKKKTRSICARHVCIHGQRGDQTCNTGTKENENKCLYDYHTITNIHAHTPAPARIHTFYLSAFWDELTAFVYYSIDIKYNPACTTW